MSKTFLDFKFYVQQRNLFSSDKYDRGKQIKKNR